MLLKSQKNLKKRKSKLYNNKKTSYKISKMKKLSKRITTRKRNLKGGDGKVELDDGEINIFIDYLMTDDKEFITKCSQFETNTNNPTTNVLRKIFGNNKIDCEQFALNVLGKVSIFKGLYDYAHKLSKEEGKNEIPELTPEEINKISKSMEHRCDNSKNNLNSNKLNASEKKAVENIIKWVYSAENIKKIFEKIIKKVETLIPNEENKENLSEFKDDLENLTKNQEDLEKLQYNIERITMSYYGLDNSTEEECYKNVQLMGLIKALAIVQKLKINPNQISSITEKIIQKISQLNQNTNQTGGGYFFFEKIIGITPFDAHLFLFIIMFLFSITVLGIFDLTGISTLYFIYRKVKKLINYNKKEKK